VPVCRASNNAIGHGGNTSRLGQRADGRWYQGDEGAQRDDCQSTEAAWFTHGRIVLSGPPQDDRHMLTNF
jgi:hypothetical protein